MTVDKNIVGEIAQVEAVQLMKNLMGKYPNEKEDSAAIILTTFENILALMALGVQKDIKPKALMREFSKNVLFKAKCLKENIEEHKKANA